MAAAATAFAAMPELSGIQRSAILVMYLERKVARSLLDKLSTDEVRSIGMAMAEVDRVDPAVIEKVVGDFVKDLHEISLLPKSGKEFALDVLPGLMTGAKATRVAGSLRRELSNEFAEYVATKPAEAVVALLLDEHPQTQAVALLLMGPDNAARVMALMDEQEQYDLALRMSRVKEIPGELVDDVEQALMSALADHGADRWSVPGVDRTAQILGRLGRPASDPLLQRLAKLDKKLSETLRRRMVVFPDLAGLDDRGIQAILKEVERADLLLALKGAPANMQDMFLRNMSSRAAADIRDELEIMGPTPRSMVNRAQENIVEVALRLADEQVIFLPLGGGDDLV